MEIFSVKICGRITDLGQVSREKMPTTSKTLFKRNKVIMDLYVRKDLDRIPEYPVNLWRHPIKMNLGCNYPHAVPFPKE